MYPRNIFIITAMTIFSIISFILCIGNRSSPLKPVETCIKDQPVEDTTRVWLHPLTRDTMEIYTKAVFARFYPWVTDTSKIRRLADKHNLRIYMGTEVISNQLSAVLCVTDEKRAEYHFTPYGKEGFCNFGADSLVEYAFGIFENGVIYPTGNIIFKFLDGTSETIIDSLFDANGLRLLYKFNDYPTGETYWTLVTPLSPKNILDLGYDLQSLLFLDYAGVEFCTGGVRIDCDKYSKKKELYY